MPRVRRRPHPFTLKNAVGQQGLDRLVAFFRQFPAAAPHHLGATKSFEQDGEDGKDMMGHWPDFFDPSHYPHPVHHLLSGMTTAVFRFAVALGSLR
jgi:hypothetical protein